MVNVKVSEFKIKIDGKQYTVRLDFRALIKFENRYENAMPIFNNFLQGKNVYDCILKILSCACVEKDFTEKELASQLSFDFQTMKLMDEITFALIEGITEKSDDESEKNSKTSQSEKE